MLNPDFIEFIELFNENDVRYLIVGGYAVAYYGHPRYTEDIDIWVWIDPANANRIVAVLQQFGFSALYISAEDFLAEDRTIQLGYPPRRIDIMTIVDGLSFMECYPVRVAANIGRTLVNIIDLDSLRVNKRASGRYQDLADLENLEE